MGDTDRSQPGKFDRVARPYRLLETLAFGRILQRSRVDFLPTLRSPGRVLILGEGDGRFLEALLQAFPQAEVTVIDASAEMLRLARERQGSTDRLTFICADARNHPLPPACFDLIVTHYFLDCFSQRDAEGLIARLGCAAMADARWLLTDFHLPAAGPARLHAALWLRTMYFFFRLATGLQTRRLPHPDPALTIAGFHLQEQRFARLGLIRSTLWRRQA